MKLWENHKHLKSKVRDWSNVSNILDLDEDVFSMSKSWTRKYTIFNLLAILKNFDFERNILIFSGG